MPRVTAAHEQEIRERIIVAALRVFGEKGFHGSTMQDIVRASGLSIGAIYTWFASKDELFMAACDLASGRGLGELAARIAAGRTTAEKLAIAVAFFFDTAEGKEVDNLPGNAEFLIQAWAEAGSEPAARHMLMTRRQQLVVAGSMLLEEGIARGELPRWLDTVALARAYAALLDGMLLTRMEQGTAWKRSEAEKQAREILALVLASAASETRPDVPTVAPQPYSLIADAALEPEPAA
jgi:AcrR family transcriptional regulator